MALWGMVLAGNMAPSAVFSECTVIIGPALGNAVGGVVFVGLLR